MKQTDPDPQDAWLKQVKQDLDEASEQLDYRTQMQLRRARQRALNAPKSPPLWQRPPVLVLATGLLVALLAVPLWKTPDNEVKPSNVASLGVLEDLPLLSTEDDLELYQSLEFLQWLEQNHVEMG